MCVYIYVCLKKREKERERERKRKKEEIHRMETRGKENLTDFVRNRALQGKLANPSRSFLRRKSKFLEISNFQRRNILRKTRTNCH